MSNRDLYGELYGQRMLVFIEEEPQSNKYRQVQLDEEEFKKVSFSFGRETGKIIRDDVLETEIFLSDETYILPDLPEIYY